MKFKVMSCNGYADKIIYLIYLVKNFQRCHKHTPHGNFYSFNKNIKKKNNSTSDSVKGKRDDGYPDSVLLHRNFSFFLHELYVFNNEKYKVVTFLQNFIRKNK